MTAVLFCIIPTAFLLIFMATLTNNQPLQNDAEPASSTERFSTLSLLAIASFLIFFFANFLGAITLSNINGYNKKYVDPRYEQAGTPIVGQITQVRHPAASNSPTRNFTIKFEYQGQPYQILEKSTLSVPYPEYNTGDKVELVILPENPQRFAVLKGELEQQLLLKAYQRNFRNLIMIMIVAGIAHMSFLIIPKFTSRKAKL